MGAEQSSNRGQAPQERPKKTDYYELLGVDRQATDDEIKKAYRKKALELHPDRNYGQEEAATSKFAEVQGAYEVLSDPQERAWYDSHRDAILRGDDPADGEAAPEYYDVRLTTAEELFALIGKFNSSVPFTDAPNGFFGILQDTFDSLAQQEIAAAEWDGQQPVFYPPFGGARDGYDEVAKPFYNAWANFSTRKSFGWKEKWRLSDAPDRRVRRLMEKENKKFREDAIREFNDAVRSFVAFVRKRDPRYIPNSQSEAERQKVLRDAAAAQAARARAAHQEKLSEASAVPDWAQSREDERNPHEGEFSETEEESEVEYIECVVCNKTFKSERQFEAHEKSKKHIKAVQQLRRQMKKENANFDLHAEAGLGAVSEQVDGDKEEEANARLDEDIVSSAGDAVPEAVEAERNSSPAQAANKPDVTPGDSSAGSPADSTTDDSEENDEYASRNAVEERLGASGPDGSNPIRNQDISTDHVTAHTAGLSVEDGEPVKKIGKAKAKREKKAARLAGQQEADPSNKCAACNELFDSKNKLFKHIQSTGHAALKIPSSAKTGKKKR